MQPPIINFILLLIAAITQPDLSISYNRSLVVALRSASYSVLPGIQFHHSGQTVPPMQSKRKNTMDSASSPADPPYEHLTVHSASVNDLPKEESSP